VKARVEEKKKRLRRSPKWRWSWKRVPPLPPHLRKPQRPLQPVRLRAVEEIPEGVRRTLRTFMPPLKAVSAVMGEGGEVIVSDVLRNPKTGAPLLNTRLYASVGTRIITATSDERGAYTIKFYPSAPGSYYTLVALTGWLHTTYS
jgi:hypothetical protein